jgi:hypothetical protein
MSSARASLYKLVGEWEDEASRDSTDTYPYTGTLNEILYHAELRFKNYLQFRNTEGEFSVRLKSWLDNVQDNKQKKALFKILRWLQFIDHTQVLSLCRDAYRRIIIPWISSNILSAEDMLSSEYEANLISLMRQYSLFSITESFYFSDFLNVNDLTGLPKPVIFGEDEKKVKDLLPSHESPIQGVIIFEDMVGTGKQASKVLKEVRRNIPREWRILFVPLIILEEGLKNLTSNGLASSATISPVLVVPASACIKEKPTTGEPPEFSYIRALVKNTAKRVLDPSDTHDDPPNNPFGYKGCGSLVVTYRNTPNNTLPLIHHRAPMWNPLFRRLHHKKVS